MLDLTSMDFKDWKKTMKEYLHTLSLMTDEKLAQLLASKGFESIKLELQIELIKTEIDRRSGV